jgi:serralysin
MGGLPNDTMYGGDGNDKIYGGDGNDILFGGLGSNTLEGGAGNDVLSGGSSKTQEPEVINGGTGIDTVDYSALSGLTTFPGTTVPPIQTGVVIFLEQGVGNLRYFESVPRPLGVPPRFFDHVDTLISIENVIGTLYSDQITADGNNNSVRGLAGNDFIQGLGGNDVLDGGADGDILQGGLGRDILTGGAGPDQADYFLYQFYVEIGNTAATRDLITDFTQGTDKFDFRLLANDTNVVGGQPLVFGGLGTSFDGTLGQLKYYQVDVAGTANDRTFVIGDNNGDKVGDFQIELAGLKALAASDFIL